MDFCKGGIIKIREFQQKVSDEINVKKDGKQFVAVVEKTGEIVRRGETRDEVNELFWKNLENPPNLLAYAVDESITFEEGFTIGDIFDIIDANPDIEYLLNLFYPFWKNYNPVQTEVEEIVIKSVAEINDGIIKVSHKSNYFPTQDSRDLKVRIDNIASVYQDGKLLFDGESYLVLFNLLEALFGSASAYHLDKPMVLSPDGLFEGDQAIYEPLNYLLQPCILSEGFKVGDLFNFVKQHEDLVKFISLYDRCNADAFHVESVRPVEQRCSHVDKIHYLLISAMVYRDKHGKYPWNVNLGVDDVIGHGEVAEDTRKRYEDNGQEVPAYDRYGISMSAVNLIVDLPLMLDQEVAVFQQAVYGGKKVFKQINPEINFGKFKFHYTLLDILHSVYWDISFFGSPVKRDEMSTELDKRVEQVKDGSMKTISMEEAFEEWGVDMDDDDDEIGEEE